MEELSSLLLQHLQTMLIRQRQRSREQRRRKAVERQLEISLQNVVSGRRARKAVNYAEIGEIGGFEEEGQDPRTASLSAGVTREERMRARQERRVSRHFFWTKHFLRPFQAPVCLAVARARAEASLPAAAFVATSIFAGSRAGVRGFD